MASPNVKKYSYMKTTPYSPTEESAHKVKCGIEKPWRSSSNWLVNQDTISRLGKQTVLKQHRGCVNCLEWSGDGDLLLSGSDDQQVCVWDGNEGKLLLHYETAHMGNVFSVKFMPLWNEELVVSGAACSLIQVQNLSNLSQPLHLIRSHRGRLKRLATAPGERNLFWSAAEDGTVREFDLREMRGTQQVHTTTNCLLTGEALQLEAKCICVNPVRTEQVAVGWSDAAVRIFDRRFVTVHRPFVFSTEGEVDPRVQYYAPQHLTTSRHFFDRLVTYVAFSHDGSELLANNAGDGVYIYDVRRATSTAQQLKETQSLSSLVVDKWPLPRRSHTDSLCEPPPAKVRSVTEACDDSPPAPTGSSSSSSWFHRRRPTPSDGPRPLSMQELNNIVREELLLVSIHSTAPLEDEEMCNSRCVPLSVCWLFQLVDATCQSQSPVRCENCAPTATLQPLIFTSSHALRHLGRLAEVLRPYLASEQSRTKLKACVQNSADITLVLEELAAVLADVRTSWRMECEEARGYWTQEEMSAWITACRCVQARLYLLHSHLLLLRNWRCDAPLAYQQCVRAYQLYNQSSQSHVDSDCEQCSSEFGCPWTQRYLVLTAALACCVADVAAEDEFPALWRHFEDFFGATEKTESSEQEDEDFTKVARMPLSERLALVKAQVDVRTKKKVDKRMTTLRQQLNSVSLSTPQEALYGAVNTLTDIKEANFFGASGQFVVAGSDDGCVYMWQRASHNLQRLITADSCIVNVVQPHPWDCRLATSGLDSDVQLWSVQPLGHEETEEVTDHREHLEENWRRRNVNTHLGGLGDLNLEFVPTVVLRGRGSPEEDEDEENDSDEETGDGQSREAVWWRDLPPLIRFITSPERTSATGGTASSDASSSGATSGRGRGPAVIIYHPFDIMSLLMNQSDTSQRDDGPSASGTEEGGSPSQQSSSSPASPREEGQGREDTPD